MGQPPHSQTPAAAAAVAACPRVRVMGVEYVHLELPDGDDLYLTEHGLPFAAQLMPDGFWTDQAWSRAHRERLNGTSTVYRIRTKPAGGKSKDIVLKWNRMGQDVPGATQADDLLTAEFNSPFEEFALTLELRRAAGPSGGRLYTHKPLAIYVPAEYIDSDRLGRKAHRVQSKQRDLPEIRLHLHRNYAVIYEWTKGIDAAQARRAGLIEDAELAALVRRVADEMKERGFVVRDNKPHHIIVRPDNGRLLKARTGRTAYAYVDFELLARTPQHEQEVRAAKRRAYLRKQAHRFEARAAFPPHLRPMRVFGVDYVCGRIESTNGALWVVGRDPELFDYFLPEKWRKTPRVRHSLVNQVYETTTKDNVRLVWRVSRVGELPDMDPFKPDERRILEHGYNSPFEEVALAMTLTARGIGAVYPRAVYRTGAGTQLLQGLDDNRRLATHRHLRTPDGEPILLPGHGYIILWGYWNGPDELLAVKDAPPYTSLNALHAYREGLLDEATYLRLLDRAGRRLADAGIEDLNLRGNHLLLSREAATGRLALDPDGLPTVLICNFELLKQTPPADPGNSPASP